MFINPAHPDNFDRDLICVKITSNNSYTALTCKISFNKEYVPELYTETVDPDTGDTCFILKSSLKDWIYEQYVKDQVVFFFVSMNDAILFMRLYNNGLNSNKYKKVDSTPFIDN